MMDWTYLVVSEALEKSRVSFWNGVLRVTFGMGLAALERLGMEFAFELERKELGW
jgi:hypothetical protein